MIFNYIFLFLEPDLLFLNGDGWKYGHPWLFQLVALVPGTFPLSSADRVSESFLPEIWRVGRQRASD